MKEVIIGVLLIVAMLAAATSSAVGKDAHRYEEVQAQCFEDGWCRIWVGKTWYPACIRPDC